MLDSKEDTNRYIVTVFLLVFLVVFFLWQDVAFKFIVNYKIHCTQTVWFVVYLGSMFWWGVPKFGMLCILFVFFIGLE